MSMSKRYFKLLIKRNNSYLPFTLPGSIILCFFVIGLAAMIYLNLPLPGSTRKYEIGVVGDSDDKYLNLGVDIIMGHDSIGDVFEYRWTKSEKEAYRLFTHEKIDAYVIFHKGWKDSIETGKNNVPVKVVVASGQKGISSILIGKAIDTLSDFLGITQTSAFSVYEVGLEHGDKNPGKESDDFIVDMLNLTLDRNRMISINNVKSPGGGYSSARNFTEGSTLFAMLLLGIIYSPIFLRRNVLIEKLLKARGVGAYRQVFLEYFSYLLHYLFCLLVVFLIMNAGVTAINHRSILRFIPEIIIVSVAFSSMQFLCFELTEGVVSSLMLQAGALAGMSYISGYFYLKTMFPKPILLLGTVLPTGRALLSLDYSYLYGSSVNGYNLTLLMYAAGFIIVSGFIRSIKLKGSMS